MLRWSVLLVGGVLAVASAMPAAAAPLVPTQYPTRSASDADIVKVHGFHRSCRWGPRRGWWHRHVGPYGRPVHCGRYRYYRYYHGGPYWHRFGHHRRFHHHRFHHRRWR
jgi:hypothetical protein